MPMDLYTMALSISVPLLVEMRLSKLIFLALVKNINSVLSVFNTNLWILSATSNSAKQCRRDTTADYAIFILVFVRRNYLPFI